MSRIRAVLPSSSARIGLARRRRWKSRRSEAIVPEGYAKTRGKHIAVYVGFVKNAAPSPGAARPVGVAMAAATPERRSIWRVGSESTWTTVVPVVFIIASLLSLVILPIVFSVHTARMRREITRVAEPARLAANRIQMDLSAEVDRLMAFQATEQKQYRDAYLQKIEEQRHDYNTLRSLGPQLGVDVGQKLNRLVKEGSEWHEGVQRDEFISRKLPAEVFMSRMFQEHPQYEQSLQASNELETAIQASMDERLSRIRSTERLDRKSK